MRYAGRLNPMRTAIQYIGSILPYATLLTVIVGAISATINLVHSRRLRALTAAVQLVQGVQTPEFTRSVMRVIELPERADAQALREDPELLEAAYVVGQVFEGLGVLVFYRLLPLELVDHLIGGYVRACWRRLEPHVRERRETIGTAMYGEWFQWLAERMLECPAPGKRLGAPAAYKKWRPRSIRAWGGRIGA